MAEITATKRIQFTEYEKLFEYYALLLANITEAKKANLMEALLTQANVALMEQPLPAREVEEWRSRQAKYAQHHHADAFVEFVEDREEWALRNIAYSTTSSSNGSTSASSGTRRNYERKEVKVMAVMATNKGEVHFPPPKKWSPDHPWGWPCLVDECRQGGARPYGMHLVQRKKPRGQAGNCPEEGVVHTLLPTPGYEAMLVSGQG
jgi:hypothetical protein